MTSAAWVLAALALLIGLVDWVAVHRGARSVEYVAKPATMLPLIGAALALDPTVPAMRPWFVAALVCSLAGDVFLMLPKEETWFVPGLGSFLVGHILYIVGLTRAPLSTTGLVVAGVVLFTLGLAVGPTIVKGAIEVDRRLGVPVSAYIATISVMVAVAAGDAAWAGVVGAALFYVSDFCIGWSRFVNDFRHARVVIIVTYHLAQIGLVVSLAAPR